MEFGVCDFLSLRDFYALRRTCKHHAEMPRVLDHLVPKWCTRINAHSFAMLQAGQGHTLINIPHDEYNLCMALSSGALFVSTRHTRPPLFVTPDLQMVHYYLGIFDIYTMCALSDDRVVVSTAHSSRVYDNATFESKTFTPYRYSKLLSVPSRGIVYGKTSNEYPARVVRIDETGTRCEDISVMRNPMIAVTDTLCIYAEGMGEHGLIYCTGHGNHTVHVFARMPAPVMQMIGMPNNKVAVRCMDRHVYLFENSESFPARVICEFNMGVGHMRALGDAIYCFDWCLCTTTNRAYPSRYQVTHNILGVCNKDIVAVARSRAVLA